MLGNHLRTRLPERPTLTKTPSPKIHHLLFAAALCGISSASMAAASNESIRSAERTTFSQMQIAESLAADALPDPAAALKLVDSSASANPSDQHFPDWSFDDAWITDIGTLLYRDDDQDGFFAGFSLTIDSDSRYQHTEVHAVIDVQRPFSAREFLHKTSTFSLYQNTLSDEYRVDIELVKNYPAGEYDLFIDLVDSNSHRILDSVSAQDFTNLKALPLESEDFDFQFHAPTEPQPVTQNDDIRVVEYAGGTGLLLILALGTLLLGRYRQALPGHQYHQRSLRECRRGSIPTFILWLLMRQTAHLNTQGDETGDGRLPARTSTLT